MGMDTQTLANHIYDLVEKNHGIERYKPQDIFKMMIDDFKDQGVNKKACKEALKTLIQSEKLTYTVLNGSCTSLVGLPGCEDENTDVEVTAKQ